MAGGVNSRRQARPSTTGEIRMRARPRPRCSSRTRFVSIAAQLGALMLAMSVSACSQHVGSSPPRAAVGSSEGLDIDNVVREHFASVNELDPEKRRGRMSKLYAAEALFVDPHGIAHGPQEMAAVFGGLHAKFPGASFTLRGQPQRHHEFVRALWSLGRPNEPPLHTGEDIFTFDGGMIRAIYVFIDPDPPPVSSPMFVGVDHVGITVPSITAATDFFEHTLGCVAVTSTGSFKSEDDWLSVHLGVNPRAEVVEIAMLRCGFGSNVELFEYRDSTRSTRQPNNADIGGHHLAFYTPNMAEAIRSLEAHGVKVMGAPTTKTSGQTAGETFVYFLSPWGLQLELVSAPRGKQYEATTHGPKLWSTERPGQ
jgi:catechol 2,3-dioxygenase-like lactoylglutathione lyase family enzyme